MGEITSMPDKDYFAAKAVSRSTLEFYARGMTDGDVRRMEEEPPEPSAAMQFGTAVHTAFLEPDSFEERVGLHLASKSRNTKAFREQALGDPNPEKVWLLQPEYNQLQGMVTELRHHPLVKGIMQGAKVEQALFWTDPETGVRCKAKLDIMARTWLYDLKTTSSPYDFAIRESMQSYGYYRQAYYYSWGYECITGEAPDGFAFIFSEKKKPYRVRVVRPDPGELERAKEQIHIFLRRYAHCLERGEWPDFPVEITAI